MCDVVKVEVSKIDSIVERLDKAIAISEDIMRKSGIDDNFEDNLEEARRVAEAVRKNIK